MDPYNAKKLAQLAYVFSESESTREKATGLFCACIKKIKSSPDEDFSGIKSDTDADGTMLETEYLKKALPTEQSVYYFRLAQTYQLEAHQAETDTGKLDRMERALECYTLAWQTGAYEVADQADVDELMHAVHQLEEIDPTLFEQAKSSLIERAPERFTPLFDSINEHQQQVARVLAR